jgi:hypothetical protein
VAGTSNDRQAWVVLVFLVAPLLQGTHKVATLHTITKDTHHLALAVPAGIFQGIEVLTADLA